VPRASVTVLIPSSSPRALPSILAAASELEKRAGNRGRALRDEKKRGEGGCPVGVSCTLLDKRWPRRCRLRRLCCGSLPGVVARTGADEGVASNVGGKGRFCPASTRLPPSSPREMEPVGSGSSCAGHGGCGGITMAEGRWARGVRGARGARPSRWPGAVEPGAVAVSAGGAVSLRVKMDGGSAPQDIKRPACATAGTAVPRTRRKTGVKSLSRGLVYCM
jgi:hypothetical protein